MTALEAMTAAAHAAAMPHLVKGELRVTDPGNHHQATAAGGPPVQQLHLCCALPGCQQSMLCLSYDTTGGAYLYPLEQLVSSVAAHVAQCHSSAPASQPAPI